MSDCLDDNAIAALIEGKMAPEERAGLVAHIDGCATCRALVADTARIGDDGGAPRVLGAGTRLGRYVVLETVGAGAMGVVYAAYDPELGRRVALKLLRPDPLGETGSGSQGARSRLLREAQSLAKLSHPHVIAIHDVGTLDGEVFLTMEFVEGGTLRDWLAAEHRGWRAVAALLRQAGEGLAAAHDAGLIHRDLKPDNILVGPSGRAKVTDFGLARGSDEVAETEASAERSVSPPIDPRLTATGMLLGTPAYMAPEQLTGSAADAFSDQYSYCVTFYEALYGKRPLQGKPPPAKVRVPSWLRKIVARGLAKERRKRFPSMRALLDALEGGPGTWPKRAAIVAVLSLIPIAAFGASRRTTTMCTGADAAWNGAWDEARAAEVRATFERTGRPSASDAFREVARILDDESTRWRKVHKDTCEATRVRGEQSEVALDLRMRCLDVRRNETGALARLLAEADGDLVERSVSAALSLPSLDECANLGALSQGVTLPGAPEVRAHIERLNERLAQANALEYAGRYEDGLAVANVALGEARGVGFAPSTAKLLLVEGRLAIDLRDYSGGEHLLHEAAAVAQDAHEDLVAADAWTTLVRAIGFNLSRPEEGRIWARYSEAAIKRAGGDDEREASRLRNLATVVWRRQGKLDEARDLIQRARVLYEKSHGARYEFQLASCDEGIAGIYFDMGRPADALVLHRSAAEVREHLFGKEHPSLATSCVNQGEDLTALGRPDEAIPLIERAIAISAPTHARGGDAYYHHRLAAALRAKGDASGALAEDRIALAGSTLAGETGGYWESWSLTGLGLDFLALGRPAEAVDPLERAARERASGAVPFEVAETRFALARASWATGAPERGRTLAKEARDILAGGPHTKMLDEIQHWIDAHP